MKRIAHLAIVAALAGSGAAQADPVADFYAGKQMKMIIRTGPGGDYDQYSRLLARHLARHIPGKPQALLPVNMAGAGGIVAANYMAEVAPKDGTVVGMLNQGLFSDQVLGLSSGLKADLRSFNWLGLMTPPNVTLSTGPGSATKTLADAMRRETLIGTSGAGSVSVQLPAIANTVLGTKLKIIFGYLDGAELDLAIERGELDGRAMPWFPGYRNNVLIQTGLKKNPRLPEAVPLLRDLGTSAEDKAILGFLSNTIAIGWPIGTTPGVPPERVAALRRAFDETLTDPLFLKEVAQENAIIERASAAELVSIIDALYATPPVIREKAKQAMEPKPEQQGEHAKGAGK
jgi:tripartite-type tricarboxylate transporter receptor subunit TctC